MPNSTETGHAKNAANFQTLISFCSGYGAKYVPTNPALKIASLNTILVNAQNSLKAVNTAIAPYNNAVHARDVVFTPLSKLVTRIISALDSTTVSKQVVKEAQSLANKLHGRRATAIDTPPPTPPTNPPTTPPDASATHSASQMSYDHRIENFSKLITLLSNQPLYAPNEADLQVPALNMLLSSMQNTNTAVINTTTPLSNARIARNDVLYAPTTGLHDIALAVKNYVKSIFGATSAQFKQVSQLKFTESKL